MNLSVYLLICSFVRLFVCLFIHLFIYLLIYLFIHLFTYLFIYLFIYIFIHSFIHLFIFPFHLRTVGLLCLNYFSENIFLRYSRDDDKSVFILNLIPGYSTTNLLVRKHLFL